MELLLCRHRCVHPHSFLGVRLFSFYIFRVVFFSISRPFLDDYHEKWSRIVTKERMKGGKGERRIEVKKVCSR